MTAPAYPVRLPLWKLAVQLGFPIRADVLVAFDHERQTFDALCADFDRKAPIRAEAASVAALQQALSEPFVKALAAALGKDPLMRPHLEVRLQLVAALPDLDACAQGHADEPSMMLPRCCSARRFSGDKAR